MTGRLVFLADIYGVDDAGDLSWMDHAVCTEVDPEAFHPGKGEPSEPAKELCRSCESRIPCLAYALDLADTWGVWGGFSAYGRVEVARQHQSGRSLADIIAEDDAAYYGRLEAQDGLDPNERRRAAERRIRAEKRAAIELAANHDRTPEKAAAA